MGKFARSVAHVKNVTVDPVTTAGKFIGRGVKTGAIKVKDSFANGIVAVREEESDIEMRREHKRSIRKMEDTFAEQAAEAMAGTARPKPTKASKPVSKAAKKATKPSPRAKSTTSS